MSYMSSSPSPAGPGGMHIPAMELTGSSASDPPTAIQQAAIDLQSNSLTSLFSSIKEIERLRAENESLKHQLAMHGPLNDLMAVLLRYDKPIKRPEHFPHTVLWSFSDIHQDPEARPSSKNAARPPMHTCVRNADGTVVSSSAYNEVVKTVEMIYKSILEPCIYRDRGVAEVDPRPLSMIELRTRFPTEWSQAINELEEKHRPVSLCSRHWKAEHLFQQHIATVTSNRQRRLRQGNSNPTPHPKKGGIVYDDVSNILSGDSSSPLEPLEVPPAPAATPALPKPSESTGAVTSVISDNNKRVAVDAGLGVGVDSNHQDTSRKRARTDQISKHDAEAQISSTFNHTIQPDLEAAALLASSQVDISAAAVSPSLSNLLTLFTSKYSYIKNGAPLLRLLQQRDQLERTDPSKLHSASPDTLLFISQITNANPNDPTLDEDNSDGNWGHYQFTAGSLTISAVLVTWTSIGSASVACQLLAAALKTRRAAEQICLHRRKRPSSYLSDIYLELMVDKIHSLLLTQAGVQTPMAPSQQEPHAPQLEIEEPLGASNPSSTDPPSSPEVELACNRLAELNVEQLKSWIKDKNITTTSKLPRNPKKDATV
ncbi:hypothetical protein CVT24_010070 [Panaeolus cyanescens]|uniref:Uncharacterized protein n=1 Tax=Panaeolus cyanescens TaxID=181874 RepID=A0A409WM06_9AGAR|nr:hypothetical protein CVT24_010070 [Panaeolus cyanescens]